jgi:hypothetical protein
VDWEDHLDGLQFDDHRVVYQQIDSKSTVKLKLLVPEWHLDLAFDVKAAFGEFVFKALFVDTLEQARAERLMNLKRGVDDDAGDLVDRVGYWCSL